MQSALAQQIEKLALVKKLRFDRMMRVQTSAASKLNRSIEELAERERTQVSLENAESQIRGNFLATTRSDPQDMAYHRYLVAELTSHACVVDLSHKSVNDAKVELKTAKQNTNSALRRVKKMTKVQEAHKHSEAEALDD